MHVLIIGAGVVGARLAAYIVQTLSLGVAQITLADRLTEHAGYVAKQLGGVAQAVSLQSLLDESSKISADIVVLASASGSHAKLAQHFLSAGSVLLSTSDSVLDVRQLLELDNLAKDRHALLLAGVGMAPGLSDVLAAKAAAELDRVAEVHVAKFGTAGPACARQHHRALSSLAVEWQNGWRKRAGGSGRELCWFPKPVDAADCYRAALADPLLLQRSFPDARRISARMAATRRDRLSSWLPMLRPPHPEGKLGAVRVDVRGELNNAWCGRILGAAAPPATATAVVLLSTIELITEKKIQANGVMGLPQVVAADEFLGLVEHHGVVCEEFVGS